MRREQESRPLTLALKQWAEQQTALPRSALADALGYLLGHWTGLTAFLEDSAPSTAVPTTHHEYDAIGIF